MRCLGLGQRLVDALDGREVDVTSPSRFEGFTGEWALQEGFGW